jgi:hypothetical protein
MKKKVFTWNNYMTKTRARWTEDQGIRHWGRLRIKLDSLIPRVGKVRFTRRKSVTRKILHSQEITYGEGLYGVIYDFLNEAFDRCEFWLDVKVKGKRVRIRSNLFPEGEEWLFEDIIGARVYFFLVRNAIKCGTALHPEVRQKHMQTANDCPVSILGYIPGGRSLERQIHQELKPWQRECQNEWYIDCEDVREIIKKYLK